MTGHFPIERRTFLVARGLGFFAQNLATTAGGEHIARTVFHAMGFDDLHATDREGRPFHLMEDGRALTELF